MPKPYSIIMTRPFTPPHGEGTEHNFYLPPNRRHPVPPLPPPPPPPLYDTPEGPLPHPYDAILLASLQQSDLVPGDYPLAFYPHYLMPRDEPPCAKEPKSSCQSPTSSTTSIANDQGKIRQFLK